MYKVLYLPGNTQTNTPGENNETLFINFLFHDNNKVPT